MTDLTEQWKKGELCAGWYYVKGSDGLFGIMSDYALYRVNLEHPDNTISLLAPVPSFEEWQNLLLDNKILKQCQEMDFGTAYTETMKTKAENQQLKELLRECRDYVVNTLIELKNGYCYEENDYYHETKTLLTEITNAIGEKK